MEIRPSQIIRFFNDLAFGDPDPGPNPQFQTQTIVNGDGEEEEQRIGVRSDTLAQYKKAISYYMPYKNVPWCRNRGNPTRSGDINAQLKRIKLMEVRGIGEILYSHHSCSIRRHCMRAPTAHDLLVLESENIADVAKRCRWKDSGVFRKYLAKLNDRPDTIIT